MQWQHVCVTAVWSFISTKWQINQGAATVGLCSLSVCTINLGLQPPPPLLPLSFSPFIRQGCGWGYTDLEKQLLLWKNIPNIQTTTTIFDGSCSYSSGSGAGTRRWSWTLLCVISLLSMSPVIGMDTRQGLLSCLGGDGTGWCVWCPQMASPAVSIAKRCPQSLLGMRVPNVDGFIQLYIQKRMWIYGCRRSDYA